MHIGHRQTHIHRLIVLFLHMYFIHVQVNCLLSQKQQKQQQQQQQKVHCTLSGTLLTVCYW